MGISCLADPPAPQATVSPGAAGALPLLSDLATAAAGDRDLHWDELRHRPPPEGLSHEQWWLVEKLSRRPTPLPLLARDGKAFWFSQPPAAQRPFRVDDPERCP